MWKELFKLLRVNLLVSTAHHPQTDGLSEQTNQTVKIALRYFITLYPNAAWHSCLPALQSTCMNSFVSTIGATSNKILYGFSTQGTLGMLDGIASQRISKNDQRELLRREASDVIDFAYAKAKL